MSRYGGDYSPRGPPVERWNPERFERERGGRQTHTVERDHYEERDSYSSNGNRRRESSADDFYRRSSGPGRGSIEEDRYYDRQESYGPPAPIPRRDPYGGRERGYREEDRDIEYDSYQRGPGRSERETYFHEEDRRFSGGRGAPRPPRPGQLIRRQSSLDTFDRRPARPRYGPQRPRSPEIIPMRGPRQYSPPRRFERDYEDDITIADYDRYGDRNFHGWKEREVETIRRRRRSSSQDFKERDTFREETIEERHAEKPYPRKGKTKMSARLVNKRAIIDMGYPFEEDFTPKGHFIILQVALNKDLIDLVLLRSKEYNERERDRITYAIEAPPPAPAGHGDVIERREIIIDKAVDDIPRSVREWDQMSGAIDSKSTVRGGNSKSEYHNDKLSVHGSSHHTRRKSRGRSSSRTEIKISKHSHSRSRSRSSSHDKALVIERKKSKSKSRRHSHHRSEKEPVIEEEKGESNAMHTGPLALVLPAADGPRAKSRRGSERRGKNEILELEIEREGLRKERRRDRRKHRRVRRRSASSSSSSSSSDSDPEILIERRGSRGRTEDYKIKEKKGSGDSKIVKGMLATLT